MSAVCVHGRDTQTSRFRVAVIRHHNNVKRTIQGGNCRVVNGDWRELDVNDIHADWRRRRATAPVVDRVVEAINSAGTWPRRIDNLSGLSDFQLRAEV